MVALEGFSSAIEEEIDAVNVGTEAGEIKQAEVEKMDAEANALKEFQQEELKLKNEIGRPVKESYGDDFRGHTEAFHGHGTLLGKIDKLNVHLDRTGKGMGSEKKYYIKIGDKVQEIKFPIKTVNVNEFYEGKGETKEEMIKKNSIEVSYGEATVNIDGKKVRIGKYFSNGLSGETDLKSYRSCTSYFKVLEDNEIIDADGKRHTKIEENEVNKTETVNEINKAIKEAGLDHTVVESDIKIVNGIFFLEIGDKEIELEFDDKSKVTTGTKKEIVQTLKDMNEADESLKSFRETIAKDLNDAIEKYETQNNETLNYEVKEENIKEDEDGNKYIKIGEEKIVIKTEIDEETKEIEATEESEKEVIEAIIKKNRLDYIESLKISGREQEYKFIKAFGPQEKEEIIAEIKKNPEWKTQSDLSDADLEAVKDMEKLFPYKEITPEERSEILSIFKEEYYKESQKEQNKTRRIKERREVEYSSIFMEYFSGIVRSLQILQDTEIIMGEEVTHPARNTRLDIDTIKKAIKGYNKRNDKNETESVCIPIQINEKLPSLDLRVGIVGIKENAYGGVTLDDSFLVKREKGKYITTRSYVGNNIVELTDIYAKGTDENVPIKINIINRSSFNDWGDEFKFFNEDMKNLGLDEALSKLFPYGDASASDKNEIMKIFGYFFKDEELKRSDKKRLENFRDKIKVLTRIYGQKTNGREVSKDNKKKIENIKQTVNAVEYNDNTLPNIITFEKEGDSIDIPVFINEKGKVRLGDVKGEGTNEKPVWEKMDKKTRTSTKAIDGHTVKLYESSTIKDLKITIDEGVNSGTERPVENNENEENSENLVSPEERETRVNNLRESFTTPTENETGIDAANRLTNNMERIEQTLESGELRYEDIEDDIQDIEEEISGNIIMNATDMVKIQNSIDEIKKKHKKKKNK